MGDTPLIACHHHLGAFGYGGHLLRANRHVAACAIVRINHFSDALFPEDGARDSAEHADHLVVDLAQLALLAHQHFRDKHVHHISGHHAARRRVTHGDIEPERRIAEQQIANTAKPGEKRRKRRQVDLREAAMGVQMSQMRVMARYVGVQTMGRE